MRLFFLTIFTSVTYHNVHYVLTINIFGLDRSKTEVGLICLKIQVDGASGLQKIQDYISTSVGLHDYTLAIQTKIVWQATISSERNRVLHS